MHTCSTNEMKKKLAFQCDISKLLQTSNDAICTQFASNRSHEKSIFFGLNQSQECDSRHWIGACLRYTHYSFDALTRSNVHSQRNAFDHPYHTTFLVSRSIHKIFSAAGFFHRRPYLFTISHAHNSCSGLCGICREWACLWIYVQQSNRTIKDISNRNSMYCVVYSTHWQGTFTSDSQTIENVNLRNIRIWAYFFIAFRLSSSLWQPCGLPESRPMEMLKN